MRASPVKAVFCGVVEAGAVECRARQIAGQRSNWRAEVGMEIDARDADVVVVVKWWPKRIETRAPVVWDPLDFWTQPLHDQLADSLPDMRRLFGANLEAHRPDGVIFVTGAMAHDLKPGVTVPTALIHHHARPGMAENPIRDRVRMIAYEGQREYLKEWEAAFERLAQAHDAAFVVNPASLADADLVVAARSKRFRSLMSRRWKSGVKAANAVASGTPAILMREEGCRETARRSALYFTTFEELLIATAELLPRDARLEKAAQMRALRPLTALSLAADRYEKFLMEIACGSTSAADRESFPATSTSMAALAAT